MSRKADVVARVRLRVTAGAETKLREGHPWLFAESIREQNRAGQMGELAVVYDRKDRFLAVGLYDPDSPLRLRVLCKGQPRPIDGDWWREQLQKALARRQGLFDGNTTGYRCIHGESDGWPGLVLDRYEHTLALKLYTAAWLPRLKEIAGILEEHMRGERIVLRLSRNVSGTAQAKFNRVDGEVLRGAPLKGPVIFLESGLRFEADVMRGQKTGFFIDQRENRRRVELLAKGRRVLNAFSFTGGFALYAARGGACSVTDLDLSAPALAASERNFALNKSHAAVAGCPHELLQADALDWLDQSAAARFDLVILDPPSFAKRKSEKAGALRAYAKLANLGVRQLAPGGILVSCSCSAHVSAEEFFASVRRIAGQSGRPFAELQTTRHPPDHPATFAEAEYLKAIYLKF